MNARKDPDRMSNRRQIECQNRTSEYIECQKECRNRTSNNICHIYVQMRCRKLWQNILSRRGSLEVRQFFSLKVTRRDQILAPKWSKNRHSWISRLLLPFWADICTLLGKCHSKIRWSWAQHRLILNQGSLGARAGDDLQPTQNKT